MTINKNTFFHSMSSRSTRLWGSLIYFLLMEFSAKVDARSVTDMPSKAYDWKTANYLQSHANLMKSYMNLSVAPCDDFYEYACGNYRHVKPDRYSFEKRTTSTDIVYTLYDITDHLVGRSDLAETLNVSSELRVAQRFYNACLGADLYQFPAADPNYLRLIRSIGGFPAVDGAAWNASKFSWFNMSAHLTNYGAKGLIFEKLSESYSFRPYFEQPELGFDSFVHTDNINSNSSHAYRLNEERMRGYLRSFQLTEAKIAEVIDGVFAFWREALVAAEELDESECQVFDVTNYYDIAFNEGLPRESCNSYFVEIGKVCGRHPEAVANYLSMKLLYRFDSKLKATKYQRDYCATALLTSMCFLFDKLYMAEHFTEEKRLEVSEIVQELRKGLRRSLEEADWLDSETREKALLKEKAIQYRIGSLEDKSLTDRLIREINRLEIVDSYPAANVNLHRFVVDINRFSTRHSEELPKETLPQMMLVGMQVQSFYYILDNTIYILAGVLQPPIYHHSWPLALKFGTLGYLVGHELTHGFDTLGSKFDGDGKYRSWWSNKSNLAFEDRSECFANAYSKYLIPEIDRHIDGKKTLDENIADSGGLRQAMEAYRSHMKQLLGDPTQEKTSDQLPGLDLLPEQLFFLGFAQVYCSEYKEEQYWDKLKKDESHAIEKYRVLGTLSNNEDFFQAFNCPVGSDMRPADKSCRLW